MKNLILVRHAKSSWKHNVIDHERPLKKRGFNDADLISKKFKEININIDLVLSSDAMRAKTTANIFVTNLNIDDNIFYLKHDLYDFSGNDLVKVVKSCDNSINNLMIFGHNHAITDFVNTFGNIHIENVPTCGVTIISFKIESWKNLNKGTTIKTLFPRDFKA